MTGVARIHLREAVGSEELQFEVPVEWVTVQEWGIRVEWSGSERDAGTTLFPWHNVLRVDLEPTID